MTKISDKSLMEIGRVTVQYSRLEFMICNNIWRLLNVDDNRGRAVTSGLQFNILLTMFGGLCHSVFKSGVIIVLADKCVKLAEDVSARRNQLIHSTLLPDGQGNFGAFKYRSKGLKGVTKDFKALSDDDLKKLADDIHKAVVEFAKFHELCFTVDNQIREKLAAPNNG
jgi:hypothetical protein